MLSEPPASCSTEQGGGGGGGEAGSGGAAQTPAASSEASADAGAVDATWSWERVRERFGSRPEFQAIALERSALILLLFACCTNVRVVGTGAMRVANA